MKRPLEKEWTDLLRGSLKGVLGKTGGSLVWVCVFLSLALSRSLSLSLNLLSSIWPGELGHVKDKDTMPDQVKETRRKDS